jgi:hypothetical protein
VPALGVPGPCAFRRVPSSEGGGGSGGALYAESLYGGSSDDGGVLRLSGASSGALGGDSEGPSRPSSPAGPLARGASFASSRGASFSGADGSDDEARSSLPPLGFAAAPVDPPNLITGGDGITMRGWCEDRGLSLPSKVAWRGRSSCTCGSARLLQTGVG